MEYSDIVRDVLSSEGLLEYIRSSLQSSMARLGFSPELVTDLADNLATLDVPAFIEKHRDELRAIEVEKFFGQWVPEYYRTYVVPEIPESGKVLDLGCGPATLIKLLVERGTNPEIVGIDIMENSAWKNVSGARLQVVQEPEFGAFLEREQPDIVTMTWALHHMEYEQQERYLSQLFAALRRGATVVVLEDSYAETLPPETGQEQYESFMALSAGDREKVMGALDWIANRVLSMRTTMPVPFAYRTLEGWRELFERIGFTVQKTRFLGFPEKRDINTPQSLLLAEK